MKVNKWMTSDNTKAGANLINTIFTSTTITYHACCNHIIKDLHEQAIF